MATSNLQNVSPLSIVSGAAIGQNRVIVLSAANTAIVSTAIADHAIGVALTAAVGVGELVAYQTFGLAKCVCSAAITLGDDVMCTASAAGKVSTAAGATAVVIGVAMSTTTTDGDIVTVQLALPGVDRPAVA